MCLSKQRTSHVHNRSSFIDDHCMFEAVCPFAISQFEKGVLTPRIGGYKVLLALEAKAFGVEPFGIFALGTAMDARSHATMPLPRGPLSSFLRHRFHRTLPSQLRVQRRLRGSSRELDHGVLLPLPFYLANRPRVNSLRVKEGGMRTVEGSIDELRSTVDVPARFVSTWHVREGSSAPPRIVGRGRGSGKGP